MGAHSIFVFTHDSIGLGQDGPTHQPIEHLTSLRAMPGLTVFRPADANETTAAWRVAIGLPGPVALVLTRQALPVLDPKQFSVSAGVAKGAYVLLDEPDPDLVLVATGSEVHLALQAAQALAKSGTRAVSYLCHRGSCLQNSPPSTEIQFCPSTSPRWQLRLARLLAGTNG
jgi:transketolase